MQEEILKLSIPAVLYGEPSSRVFVFVHGLHGNKTEAARFAAQAPGWQVLAADLPGHGERSDIGRLTPWCVVPELREVLHYAQSRFSDVALHATSLGAWFSLMAFSDVRLARALFVSPICDMDDLICGKLLLARISEAQLEREGEIPLPDGSSLSWEYLQWVRAHRLTRWDTPTDILRGEFDNVAMFGTLQRFTDRFGGSLCVMPEGEHWFHTDAQLAFEDEWTRQKLQ